MPTIEFAYTPYPKQAEFHACPADEVLFGGAAGPGKSRALRMEAVKICLLYPGMHAILFRRTYPELEMEIIRKLLDEVPRELYTYNDTKKRLTFRNGSVLQFGYCDQDRDILRYQGAEFGWIGWDELTHMNEYPYLYMLSRLRSTDATIWPRVRATTNPGGVGHAWVKTRFIDAHTWGEVWRPEPTDEERAMGIKPMTRCFIQATMRDGPYASDPGYMARLMALPEAERDALLHGNWDAFRGAAFPEWRREIHVCKPFAIPKWWRRWRSNDRGYGDTATWYWLAASPEGTVYAYREWACTEVRPSAQAEEVLRLSTYGTEVPGQPPELSPETGEPIREDIAFTAAPDDVNTSDPEAGKSWADLYRQGGLRDLVTVARLPEVRKALLHEYLAPMPHPLIEGRQTARLQVFDTCRYLIRTLPGLVIDPKNPNKVLSGGEDHGFDGLGHGLQAWHPQRSKPPEAERGVIASHKDKLAKKHLQHRKRLM